MANKYYTPNIEDFYPGYEFEYKPKPWLQIQTNEAGMKIFKEMGIKSSEFDDTWRKGVFNESHLLPESEKLEDIMWSMSTRQHEGPRDFWDISNRIKKEAIRVKYLDKEDIEALGWIEIHKNHYQKLVTNVEDFDFDYSTKPEAIYLTIRDYKDLYKITIHNDERYEEYTQWFDGRCTSINELRKIMQWLKIENLPRDTSQELLK